MTRRLASKLAARSIKQGIGSEALQSSEVAIKPLKRPGENIRQGAEKINGVRRVGSGDQ